MHWFFLLSGIIFFLVGIGGVVLTAVSLPGTWIMLFVALLIELIDTLYLPADDRQTFSWWLLGACLAVAVVGEIIEFFAGVAGAKNRGATTRGMVGAVIGGIIGAIFLTPFVPIPLVGTLVGALIGTFVGAFVGELSVEKSTLRGSVNPAVGAAIGRVFGTVGKLACAVTIWIALTVSAFWP